VIGLFYKQLKLCAFDPELAASVGIRVELMHYVLMGLVAVTTVGAFESVGAILVVAMLIVPGATAYLLTDRLGHLLGISVALGVASAALGYRLAATLDASIAGAMATVAGLFFLTAFLFSPRHGVVARAWNHARMRRQVAREDVLLWAGRALESAGDGGFSPGDVPGTRTRTVSPGQQRSSATRAVPAPQTSTRSGNLSNRTRAVTPSPRSAAPSTRLAAPPATTATPPTRAPATRAPATRAPATRAPATRSTAPRSSRSTLGGVSRQSAPARTSSPAPATRSQGATSRSSGGSTRSSGGSTRRPR